MDFVSIGDSDYFNTILLSIRQSEQFHPERSFLLYDLGFTEPELEEIRGFSGVHVIPWKSRLMDASRLFPDRSGYKIWIKRHILRHPDLRLGMQLWQRELILDEKCYCILNAATSLNGSFLYLDGDAFVVNSVDELEDPEYHLVVTLRSRDEIDEAKRRGMRHEINSGVIMFNGTLGSNVAVITEWIKEMNLLNLKRSQLPEQTGLSNLILGADPGAYDGPRERVSITIGAEEVVCRIVPTFRYNYNFVERGFDIEANRILHMKSGRGSSHLLQAVIDKIEPSDYEGD